MVSQAVLDKYGPLIIQIVDTEWFKEKREVEDALCNLLRMLYLALPTYSPVEREFYIKPGYFMVDPEEWPLWEDPGPTFIKTLNSKKVAVLNQAVALGCKWAEEEAVKFSGPIGP